MQAQVTADFNADVTFTCDGTVQFSDLSTGAPTQWLWQFGDGGLSTQQNPTYTYANSGTYAITLEATNTQGSNTVTKTAYIVVEKPKVTSTNNAQACLNASAQLSATNGTGTLRWYDGSNTLVHTGATFSTPPLTTTTAYFVEDVVTTYTNVYAGPQNGAAVGGGGYHGSGFNGGVNFTAAQAFEIVSVWVDADGGGDRDIFLWSGHVTNGNPGGANTVLDQKTINIPNGQSRIQVNFQIPAAGDYCIGGNQMDLFRNNGAAVYPYSLAGVVDLVSSTTNSQGFYYYFYNWEIGLPNECVSARETVTAEVVNANFTSIINGGTASFMDNSTGATSWLWDFGDGNTSTQQNPVHTYTTNNGPHNVTLSINNGVCSSTESVTVSVGIEQLADDMTLSIFPNPAGATTQLAFSQVLPENVQLKILNVTGVVAIERELLAGEQGIALDLNDLSNGVYWLQFSTDQMMETRKLIVNQ